MHKVSLILLIISLLSQSLQAQHNWQRTNPGGGAIAMTALLWS